MCEISGSASRTTLAAPSRAVPSPTSNIRWTANVGISMGDPLKLPPMCAPSPLPKTAIPVSAPQHDDLSLCLGDQVDPSVPRQVGGLQPAGAGQRTRPPRHGAGKVQANPNGVP